MDSNLEAKPSMEAKPSLTREQIRECTTELAYYIKHSGWLGEAEVNREETRERTAALAFHQPDPTMKGRWSLVPESIREDATAFAFRFEKAFLQYLNLGLYDLRVRASLCNWLEEAHDEETMKIYQSFGKRWEFAFMTTDREPELDPRIEVVAGVLPENLGGPDILWKSFALLKAYATSIDRAITAIDVGIIATIADALRLISAAEKELSCLQDKLSQLKRDYPILKVAEIIQEPATSTSLETMDSRERDCIERWAANVWNFIRARIRFKADENLPDSSPLGLPTRGETWNYGEEEVGVVAVAEEYLP